jgi:protease-4
MLHRLGNVGIRTWLALVTAAARLRGGRPPRLLRLRLGGELAEESALSRLRSYLGPRGEDYLALLGLLGWARRDPELRCVLVSVDRLRSGLARVQGLRRSLAALRDAGKQVWVHLTHAGVQEYYLASAAERVLLTPAGVLDVAGLSAEATFFLGTLEKLGVRAEVIQVGRYKSAGEPFTRREMSPAHREMIESLVDDLYSQISEDIAGARSLTPETARDLLGSGPYVAREALAAGLVDGIAYLDEVEKQLSEAHGGVALTDQAAYARWRGRQIRLDALRADHPPIAVVHVSGPIKTGENAPAPARASGAETLCRELDALERRTRLAAVVLRINSPGGSGLASDLIWRSVMRLRQKTPVVVSLGDVAASGGYYVAAAGAPVVAEPGTITGSIGVLAGKATLQGLYGRLGVTKDIIQRGEHAAIHSDYLPLSRNERARIEVEAQAFYDDFVSKVAEGRQLSRESVAAVAEGRVWTGKQAQARGLVDQLGGLDDALAAAKAVAGIPRDTPVAIERLPRPRRPRLLSLLQLLPAGGRLEAFSPWLAISLRERVWAVVPFHLRFL